MNALLVVPRMNGVQRVHCLRGHRPWPLSITKPCTTALSSRRRPRRLGVVVRHYMDVHTRPSHSGMFQKANKVSSPPPPEPPNSDTEWSFYTVLAKRVAMAMGIIHMLSEYVVDITLCEGPSMSPTIKPFGEIIVIDKYSMRRGVQDGIVGTERAREAAIRQRLCSKSDPDIWHEPIVSVTELEREVPLTWMDMLKHMRSPLSVGDVVVSQHPSRPGTVCKRVAGLPGDQVLQPKGSIVTVPDGHCWLEGDNPNNSSDSRSYGAIPIALLQGRVLARVWPLYRPAWMRRGGRPVHSLRNTGSTVLPAGYQGEHIRKSVSESSGKVDYAQDQSKSSSA